MAFRIDKRNKTVSRISEMLFLKNRPHKCGRVACLKTLQLEFITRNGGDKSVNTTWNQKIMSQ